MFSLLNETLNLLLPGFCSGCNKKLTAKEQWLCNNCFSALEIADSAFINSFYNEKFAGVSHINFLYSCFKYQKGEVFQKLIHKLKYEGYFRIGKFLGNILGNNLIKSLPINEYNIILPVPIHKIKKIERGFNQSEYIAKQIAKITNINYSTKVVFRKVYKESQTTYNKIERLNNIKGVFYIKNPDLIKSKNVIVVDDIITTGGTVIEITNLCKKAGANNIAVLSAGLTVLKC
ncbi:MAG TPA: ComF family protein [Melioribacteraceae bacterium]|nr:ComF family protein [Melioribacteraceae bacterium]